MASTCKCEYCDSTISTADQTCPNCGAANPLYVIDTDRIITDPQTIEELQEYCAERGMPLLRMRFFIGEDTKEAKAFGIFRDNHGDIVVYKNKADGSRAVRYKGKDERHAVNEIYGKLLEECHNRGIYPDGKSNATYMSGGKSSGNTRTYNSLGIDESLYKPSNSYRSRKSNSNGNGGLSSNFSSYSGRNSGKKLGGNRLFFLIAIIITMVAIAVIASKNYNHPSGYYQYDDTMYYHMGDNWYYYDNNADDWYYADESTVDDIYDSGREYYYDGGWNSDWGESFYDSYAYESYQQYHSSSSDDYDSDDDYDYDYGSSYDDWDSGSSDWDSDW